MSTKLISQIRSELLWYAWCWKNKIMNQYISLRQTEKMPQKKHTISMPERIIVFGGYWQGPIDQTMYIRACQM